MKQKLTNVFQLITISLLLVVIPIIAGALSPKQLLISLSESGAGMQAGAPNQLADSKMMMPNPYTYKYIAGENLSAESGKGSVFQLRLSGDPQEILQTVANQLGIKGEIFEPEYSSSEVPVFSIGSIDGTGPSAIINWSGTGSWWFNNPAAYPTAACLDLDKSDDGTEYCAEYEEYKATPAELPSKSEMVSLALEIFNATGLKVQAADIATSTYEWGASAFASMKIGVQDSPLEWAINWGANGELGSVSGHSVVAIDRGEFETISDEESVSRMSDWRYSSSIAQSIWNRYQPNGSGRVIAYDDVITTEPAVPEPSPSTITEVIDRAERTQVMIWDKSGSAWVVPGNLLFTKQGWITPVFTLQDGLVELPEPVEISPLVK